MRTVHAVLPAVVDDPARPSGGNVYDRRLCVELAARGWALREHLVEGWPEPDPSARRELAATLATVRDGDVLLVDGLLAAAMPEALATRSRLVALVHLPRGDDAEARLLRSASAVLTTSEWTRRRLAAQVRCPVYAALPGADAAEIATGSVSGGALVTVGPVAPHKGQDVLVRALGELPDLPWSWNVVGPLDRDPEFVRRVRDLAAAASIGDRITFTGPLPATGVQRVYAESDLLVVPSRGETYGMVVGEALARAVPVIATDAGGVREALGRAPSGALPGVLVPPGDVPALAAALRGWLTDPRLRRRLRRVAAERRPGLPTWSATADVVERVLVEAAAA